MKQNTMMKERVKETMSDSELDGLLSLVETPALPDSFVLETMDRISALPVSSLPVRGRGFFHPMLKLLYLLIAGGAITYGAMPRRLIDRMLAFLSGENVNIREVARENRPEGMKFGELKNAVLSDGKEFTYPDGFNRADSVLRGAAQGVVVSEENRYRALEPSVTDGFEGDPSQYHPAETATEQDVEEIESARKALEGRPEAGVSNAVTTLEKAVLKGHRVSKVRQN